MTCETQIKLVQSNSTWNLVGKLSEYETNPSNNFCSAGNLPKITHKKTLTIAAMN